jgi:spectinomycin phosphotransferase
LHICCDIVLLVMDDGAGGRARETADARLRDWVGEDFGIDLVSVDGVGYGADEAAQLWRGVSVDGAMYAVKLSGGGTPAGLVVSAHLAAHGVAGVVAPVPTRDGRLWSERDGRRLSVMPWVSEDRALGGGMTAEHWAAYGALLADVHATAVTDALVTQLPREDHTHDRVASAARALQRRLKETAHEPAGSGGNDHLVRALVAEWRTSAGLVTTLLEQADSLGRELRTREAPGVVCHGDPHLGNLLVGAVDRVWLIDWDDAVLAPRERDLMFAIGGVLAFAPVSPQEQSWFFDGYGADGVGAADLDRTRLAYYRCTRALEDLVDPAAQVLDAHRSSESERADALSIVRGVLSPTGLVSLALSSVRDLEGQPASSSSRRS